MKKTGRAISHFFTHPMPVESLGFFRIAMAAFALAQAAVLLPDWMLIYGPRGFLPWSLSDALSVSHTPAILHLWRLLEPAGLSQQAAVYGVSGLYILSLIGLLLGYKTRLMGILAWLTHMTLQTTASFTSYGVETFLHIALFYCMVLPVGACWSVDVKLGRYRQLPGYLVTLSIRLLQLHLCISYLSTGLEKAMGGQWWNGEAIWRALQQDQFHHFNTDWMAGAAWVPMLLGWGTLLVEALYPLGMFGKKTGKIWLFGIIALHTGIIFCLGLHLFGALMILLNLSAFGEQCFPGLFSQKLKQWMVSLAGRKKEDLPQQSFISV